MPTQDPIPVPLNTILSWFQTGDFPTETQFAASWSSFYHKEESIPMDKVENLTTKLQDKVDKAVYTAHLTNADAHSTTLAKLDASNLNANNVQAWKTILEVGTLPSNIATVDEGVIQGNVYTKQQALELFMMLEDFVNDEGKILADKIEALGITNLVQSTQTTLAQFAANSASYTFQDNDFIAIPNAGGVFSLYMFKGGNKTITANYLPTGLTNITIAMVEGLQAALDAKMSKPSSDGSFIAKMASGVTTWQAINPTAMYLTYWNNGNFVASPIYTDGTKLGVGTTSPTEMFHLNNGRIRSKANVLDENDETLINQITTYNRKLLFTDSTGTKKTVLTVEDLPTEFMALPGKLSETQKTTWKTEMNGGFTTASMSVFIINPVVIKKQNSNNYISLRGANLYLNPANFQVDIVDMSGNVVLNVPNSQVQLISTGLDLVFYVNLFSLALGNYRIKLRNGVAEYTTTVNFQLVDNVNSIDPSTLLWNTKVYNDVVTTKMYAVGNTVHYAIDSNVKAFADEAVYLFKAKTQAPVFPAGEDFYFEFDCPALWVNGNTSSNFFGLSVIPDYQTLNNDIIGGVALGVRGDYLNWVNFTNNTSTLEWNQTVNVILVKRGNTLTRIVTAKRAGQPNPTTFIDNVTVTDGQDLYISAIFQNSTAYSQQKFMEMNIKDMYTF